MRIHALALATFVMFGCSADPSQPYCRVNIDAPFPASCPVQGFGAAAVCSGGWLPDGGWDDETTELAYCVSGIIQCPDGGTPRCTYHPHDAGH